MDIEDKVAFLSQATAYPDHPENVDVVETHMSWVFLTDRWVYKLKKPVRYDFLDFSSLPRRQRNCEEEVRLNRRLAEDVYQGVIALTRERDGALQLAGSGEPVEWLVKMRRLPHERMLDHLIEARAVPADAVERVALKLAAFYKQASPVAITAEAYRRRLANAVLAHHRALAASDCGLSAAQLDAVKQGLIDFLARYPALFDARVGAGRIIEAHGDLRPEHICLIDPPVIIDCLEFNRAFRELDPADELAFLAMECERAGAGFIEGIVFKTYARHCADQPEPALIRFYKAFRAQLRAKLSASHLLDHRPRDAYARWVKKSRSYLDLAAACVDGLSS